MKNIKQIIIENNLLFIMILVKIVFYYLLIDLSPLGAFRGIVTLMILLITFFVCCYTNKNKYSFIIFTIIYLLVTALMFADAVYYSYFNQLTSIAQISQMNNLVIIDESVKVAMPPISILLFLDIPFAYKFSKEIKEKKKGNFTKILKLSNFSIVFILVVFIVIFAVNPLKVDAFTKVNHTEFFTYHVKDVIINVFQDVAIESKPVEEVINTINEEIDKDNKSGILQGVAKGRNLIVIQMESVQNFVINREYNGQEITPNLNKLIKKDTLYFDHYMHNIGKGNTSDAEFSTNNSFYPVIQGESYRLYQDNKFNGLPWLLRQKGYKAVAFHGYKEDFWNRNIAYVNQGFDDFISMEDFNITEKIGFGLADKEMFKQTGERLSSIEQPFYSFIITLSNHHPYQLPEEHQTLQLKEIDKGTITGDYLQSVRYTDEAIGQFIEDLKTRGLYDNSIIALYGDHHGLNCKDSEINKQMSELLGYEYDYDQLFRIPLIIHIPNLNDKDTISTVGGQVDFLPTIANLMDIKIEQPFVFGQDILNAKEGFVATVTYMFEGSFIKDGVIFEMARDGVFENSRAWNLDTREPIAIDDLRKDYEKAVELIQNSKYALDNNLMSQYSK